MAKKVRWGVSGKDVDELEDSSYEEYDGPTPPRGIYRGTIKSMKKAESSAGNDKIVVLIIIKEKGKKAKYNGAPIFDHVPVTESAMFRVKQLMTGLGGTGKDFDATVVDDDNNITKMGRIRPVGMDVRIATKVEVYQPDPDEPGERTAKIARYLPPKDEEDEGDEEEYDEEAEEEEADEEEADDSDEADEDDDDEDEDGDDDEDDDDDADEDDDDDDDDDEPEPPRRPAKKAAKKVAAKKAAPAKKATKAPAKAAKKTKGAPF